MLPAAKVTMLPQTYWVLIEWPTETPPTTYASCGQYAVALLDLTGEEIDALSTTQKTNDGVGHRHTYPVYRQTQTAWIPVH